MPPSRGPWPPLHGPLPVIIVFAPLNSDVIQAGEIVAGITAAAGELLV